ncbi:hypothetical protein Q5P01_025749 [Channa striata]|uniref:Uncharacterized protein n=1 Tax=Channa striata TaxID=64152 RepID=A0AA88LP89_CHASR|nr:hypothetical protein Q5P01_025749 [Channa striata]
MSDGVSLLWVQQLTRLFLRSPSGSLTVGSPRPSLSKTSWALLYRPVLGVMATAGIIYVPLQGRRGHNLTNVWGQLVSQRDATEKLADQVAAQIAAADRRVEEASGDPHEEEKDEAHKSSKGHVSEPAAGCPTSPESLTDRISSFTMDHEDKDDLCVGSLPRHQTKIQEPQRRVKTEDEQQRLRPPD